MTPEQLKSIRKRLGMTLEAMGKALGYESHWRQRVWGLEHGKKRIGRARQMLAERLVKDRMRQ